MAFWFGGWDADAQAFFVNGMLGVPAKASPLATLDLRRPERRSDIELSQGDGGDA